MKVIILFPTLFRVAADGGKRFGRDIVFHAAGIRKRGLFLYAEAHEKLCQNKVTLIHALRDFASALCKRYALIIRHVDIIIFP